MDSLIAEWVYYGKYKSKADFTLEIVIKFYPSLIQFIAFRDKFSNGFWFEPHMYSQFVISKRKAKQMVKSKYLLYNRDFIQSDSNEYMFSNSGLYKILTNEADISLRNLNYIDHAYNEYIKYLHELNIEIVG
jgi:hypothetical protein